MLLLPFLPIVALIVQNSMNLHDMLEYRRESAAIGLKVDGTTALGMDDQTDTDSLRTGTMLAWFCHRLICIELTKHLIPLQYGP